MRNSRKKILNSLNNAFKRNLDFLWNCLDPRLLLEEVEIGQATLVEEEEFDEWQNREILNVFDETESQVADIGSRFPLR